MKHVFFASSDPGGANVIAATIRRLPAAQAYRLFTDREGFRVPELGSRYEQIDDAAGVTPLFAADSPDIVFTGTSLFSTVELDIQAEARRRGIFTVAVVDHWTNFLRRFERSGRVAMLPDVVLVPDAVAAAIAEREGIPKNLIRVFGQPHFYDAGAFEPSASRDEYWRAKDVDPATQVLVFLSDALTETSGDTDRAIAEFGYTETGVLQAVLRALPSRAGLSIVIRPHPKERQGKYLSYTADSRVHVAEGGALWELLAHADFVVGMFSSALVEAVALGKRPLRVEIGAGERNLLPVPESMFFARVTAEADLQAVLGNYLSERRDRVPEAFLHAGFEKVMDEYLY